MKSNSENDVIQTDGSSVKEQNLAVSRAHLVRVPEAARITGLSGSLLRKSFMRVDKRPRNVPGPPPHKRIGRAVYIFADKLPAWLESIGTSMGSTPEMPKRGRGRPTVPARIARRLTESQ